MKLGYKLFVYKDLCKYYLYSKLGNLKYPF